MPLAFALNARAAQPLPQDMHEWAVRSIDLVFRENYRQAEEEARKIVRAYPDHPAGYFFLAAVAEAWMHRFQSTRREAEFYRFCDQAIERAERILAANPRDDWARFFLGGADGYKGTYEARHERYITAFRFGWKGVSVFLRMASDGSTIPDINFGIGTYEYWRSALTRMLWWMPGVPDNRASGIQKLRDVMANGLYTRTAAGMVLIDIFMNENRPQDALNLSDRLAQQHPRALVFQWGRAAALHGLNRHEEAVTVYGQILAKVEADANNTFFNSVQARMGLARSLAALGKNAEALEHITAMNNYNLTRDIRKRLDSVFSEANTLRRRLERAS
ncbi:MAG: tetratricopeptide repeat protein [Chitinispirillales bacterium]|jgi:tetratricopeptide (TPR) repeat protein|nr:tetratricopeptide repeat protein [Chitinispirillales bacterium]